MIESEVTGLARTEVILIQDGIGEAGVELVPDERELILVINRAVEARFNCAPHRIRSILAGWLVGEGVIRGHKDFISLEIDMHSGRVDITVSDDCFASLQDRILAGMPRPVLGDAPFARKTDTSLELGPEQVETLAEEFRRLYVSLKSADRMCYLASIATHDEILTYGEGFHRINSLYRSFGELILHGRDTEGKIALMNFGLSRSMVSRLARAGVAMAVCFAPPTSGAIEMANDYYVTIICAGSGAATKVYSAPWRVI